MLRSMRTLVLGFLFLLLPALAAGAAVPGAPPALYWERVSPVPHTADLLGAVYGNGLYVAVGKYGTVLTSADGDTWTTRPTGTDHHITAVTYGRGRFVALGHQGAGLISIDGETWTLLATHLTAAPLDMAYGNGRYVAVGLGGWTGVSTDGKTWRNTRSGTVSDLRGVAFGLDRFVAVGGRGELLTSADGESWERVATGAQADLQDIAFGGGEFLAVGDPGTTLRSSDAIHWDVRTQITAQMGNASRPVRFARVVYGSHGFVLADNGRYFTTVDGVTWQPHDPPDYEPSWPYLTYGKGRYVAVGWFGQTAVSTDGAEWRPPAAGSRVWLNRAAYGAGRFVAVGRDDQRRAFLMSSADGKAWEKQTVDGVGELYDVVYAAGRFVAVGHGVITSTDGQHWERLVPPSGDPLDYYPAVEYGNKRFVALGSAANVLTSPDGVHWTRHDQDQTALDGLGFGNGQFVAFGAGMPEFRFSEDGVHWTKRPVPAGYSFWNVAFGGGKFVFIADDNRTNVLLTTRDFRVYDEACPVGQEYERLDAVTYADGQFVAMGDRYGMAVSADGIEWQVTPYLGEQRSLVASGGGRLVGLTHWGSAWVSSSTPQTDAVLSTVTARQILLRTGERPSALVTVNLRDQSYTGLPGRRILLESSTGDRVEGLTDVNGNAYLTVSGTVGETVTYRVLVVDEERYLAETARISFSQ